MATRSCVCVVLLALAVSWSCEAVEEKHAATRKMIHSLFEDQRRESMSIRAQKHSLLEEIAHEIRMRRQSSGGNHMPINHGDHAFVNDTHTYGRVLYSGNSSSVILLLTYDSRTSPRSTSLYRSADYGATFQNITSQLDSPLWPIFYSSTLSNLVVFYHATQPRIYISDNEGTTWTTRDLSPNTINPRSFVWNPRQEQSAIAHDPVNNFLYVTQDLGQSWTNIAENVNGSFNYQWGNDYDNDTSVLYYNTYNSSDSNRGNYTVGLYSQRAPYSAASKNEVDPNLGRHEDFLLIGPYIYASRNDSGIIHLYISYNRQPFNRAKIPTTDPHRNYYVSHINELQAFVVVEHVSGKFNLYLSDLTGVYFSLSLADIVFNNRRLDLERINGINGTMIANRREKVNSTTTLVRTVITLDNGGEWTYLTPPEVDLTGAPVSCEPPACSLHFQMASSEYARLGVYSQDSAPGIIVAHGNTGVQLATNPNLYISRDGGVSWFQTLSGSWGVTVVDHGGLLVAADDYHKDSSTVIKYSCNEGISWRNYTYTNVAMTVYGVITEPGEETTTVSLYGVKSNRRNWDVVTVNFSSIFDRLCTDNDFYLWQPWDARTESDCILGLDVTLERRLPSRCCLIGPNYVRTVSTRVCQCSIDDYECDYGYQPAGGVNGPCVLDPAVPLDDPCADGQVKTVMKSRGYRKVAGDICTGGEIDFEPYQFTCCSGNNAVPTTNTLSPTTGSTSTPNTATGTTKPVPALPLTTTGNKNTDHTSPSPSPDGIQSDSGKMKIMVVGFSIALAMALLLSFIMVMVAAVFIMKYLRVKRGGASGSRVRFRAVAGDSSEDDTEKLLSTYKDDDDEDDDDAPLAL